MVEVRSSSLVNRAPKRFPAICKVFSIKIFELNKSKEKLAKKKAIQKNKKKITKKKPCALGFLFHCHRSWKNNSTLLFLGYVAFLLCKTLTT
jgi:hypothetical protein